MKWPIERGVPIPPRNAANNGKQLELLKVMRMMGAGDSIYLQPGDVSTDNITSAIGVVTRETGASFVRRSIGVGTRLWRQR